MVSERDEVRFYPRHANLDNAHASIHVIDTPALLISHVSSSSSSSSSGILLVFGLDFRVLLYSFSSVSTSPKDASKSATLAGLPEEQSVVMTKLVQVI